MKRRFTDSLATIGAVIALTAFWTGSAFAQVTSDKGIAPAPEPVLTRVKQTPTRGIPPAERHASPPLPRFEDANQTGEWSFPGEYESHQAMWMLWPTFENKPGFPSTDPMSDMIRAMSGHVHVNLAVQDAADEAAARSLLIANGVPLDHVHFFQLEHADIWARDMGPQFTRSLSGKLRINDWNFNMWGAEEPDSDNSTFSEPFDRTVASVIKVPTLDTRPGPVTGVRMVHEGGSVTHNGHGTMIAVESVVIQRNLGPNRFCGGQAPVTDYSQPNTYAPNPDWPACKNLVEAEYLRMLGVKKVIWLPTGIVEDDSTFR
ncbi:MAG TPA: agmatine deiminase family protein, partial [Blastocatellia bacterium]|nr:agmatine deiminase family protein [Blastocatellia bacterium]